MGFSGAESLKFSEILAYMQIHRIDEVSERKHFLRRMRLIDRLYTKLQKKGKPDGKQIRNSG